MNNLLYYIGEAFYSLALILSLPSYLISALGNWFFTISEEGEEEDGE